MSPVRGRCTIPAHAGKRHVFTLPPQASRVSRSIKAVGVDWFDGFIETYYFKDVPLFSDFFVKI